MALDGPDDALRVLETALGGAALGFDEGGVCQVTVQDAFVLNLVKSSDAALRLVTYLDAQIQPMTARFLLNAMTENHLGGAGPHGRFGLHRDMGILALEETIACQGLDPAVFEARVLGFVKTAAYWVLNADNLFDDPNALEDQVHATGARMAEDVFASYASDDADAFVVKV
ncbi:type III secretion system chaperone [Marivita sp. GX14005]|uniref:type III secretion system chaperone n=1 Tax=Marivita sp. GX14005 TaxID=2942276 RepID=UPI0020184964|nr:type III secretion system chaperone [Marivita sp. GX14005]MCL3883320.1 type III secretion system chaperone [Marivita sp. GX14005]